MLVASYIIYLTIVRLNKEVVFAPAEVNLILHELLCGKQRWIWHLLICFGNLDLLLVLVDFFQAVRMAGKLLQFVMQLLLHHDIDLVGTLGDDRNRLVNVACLLFDLGNIFGFEVIGNAISDLAT